MYFFQIQTDIKFDNILKLLNNSKYAFVKQGWNLPLKRCPTCRVATRARQLCVSRDEPCLNALKFL